VFGTQTLPGVDPYSPAALGVTVGSPFGAGPGQSTNPGIARSAVDAVSHPLSPDNGLFWAGVVILAAAGLIGFSTHVRVGPASAGAAVGNS